MKICKTNDNRDFVLIKSVKNYPNIQSYRILALTPDYVEGQDGNLRSFFIGLISYAISESEPQKALLTCITIENKDYLKCGVGYQMLRAFEDDIASMGVKNVSGDFCPFGIGSNYSARFYQRNGYEIKHFMNDEWKISKEILPQTKFSKLVEQQQTIIDFYCYNRNKKSNNLSKSNSQETNNKQTDAVFQKS